MHAADIQIVLWLMSFHYVADFILQSDWQARNKWQSNWALSDHVAIYSGAMAFAALFVVHNAALWLAWYGFTFASHWVTDWCTSRVSHHFFERKDFHSGFMVVGLDQLIHLTCLLGATYWALQ